MVFDKIKFLSSTRCTPLTKKNTYFVEIKIVCGTRQKVFHFIIMKFYKIDRGGSIT